MKILTVTLNPSIDHILTLDKIRLREKNILYSSRVFYGGKGINVGFVLGKLDISATAIGLVGRGEITNFAEKLSEVNIKSTFTPIDGATRQTYKIMETTTGKDTEFNQPGEPITANSLETFFDSLVSHLDSTDWVVMCGSIPSGVSPDIYARIIKTSQDKNVNSLLDVSGEPLIIGAKALPTFLKINISELNELKPGTGKEIGAILKAMQELNTCGIKNIVISLGGEGAIGYDGKDAWKIGIPAIEINSLTGAGDAMTAGLLAAFVKGKSFKESLQYASAVASASTKKFEPGDFNVDDLHQLLNQIHVEKLI